MGEYEPLKISFDGPNGSSCVFLLFGDTNNPIHEIDKQEAAKHHESPYQITEGCVYDFELPEGFSFVRDNPIVRPFTTMPRLGRIHPNTAVGTLDLEVRSKDSPDWFTRISLEVRSIKSDYRTEYRTMLNEIAEKCADLIMRQGSSVVQTFETNFEIDSRTAYQRFAFLKSILDSEEFTAAIHRIQNAPATRWKDVDAEKDIRSIRKIGSKAMRQLGASKNRIPLDLDHPIRLSGLMDSIPSKLSTGLKHEIVDTPENRFIKYALDSFVYLCEYVAAQSKGNKRLQKEAQIAIDQLQEYLEHSLFKEVGRIQTLPLNSPILQRKEGYREVLKAWLVAELAAKLTWEGGEDVYHAGKRDVATLYEYWLFFKLLDVIKRVFDVEPASVDDLIEITNDRLSLKLKQGNRFANQPLPIRGVYRKGKRNLEIQLAYNRTFQGNDNLDKSGSWTVGMRPDYTLSIWPEGVDVEQAESEELMVHIHFDAKYKVENFVEMLGSQRAPVDDGEDQSMNDAIDQEEREGIYKRADLLKMHTYRDAIRRSAGAYILYPGTAEVRKEGFHEIIPGLGAFAISPSKSNDGEMALQQFLEEVLKHFENRASQREQMSYYNYAVHSTKSKWEVNEPLPEAMGARRDQIPSETYVLIGYYRGAKHLDWILKNKKYNRRAVSKDKDLNLLGKENLASYLLLYNGAHDAEGRLFSLIPGKVKLFSPKDLLALEYPDPRKQLYIVHQIEAAADYILGSTTLDLSSLGVKAFRPELFSLAELFQKFRVRHI